MKKVFSALTVSLLLITMVLALSKQPIVKAASTLPSSYPLVYVSPEFVTANVGETFTISVVVYNLTDATVQDPNNPFYRIPLGNLYGFDVQFTWDPAVIKYVSHTVTVPVETYPNPVPPSPYAGILHQPAFAIKEVVDEAGNIPGAVDPTVRAWFAYSSLYPANPFNGDGTMFTMTFTVQAKGESPLHIAYVGLADTNGMSIGQSSNGEWLNPPRDAVFRLPPQMIDVYTDKSSYHAGDKMYLGLHITNPVSAIHACVAIWLVLPDGSSRLILHAHNVLLPAGLDYNNPSFRTFTLPSIKPGVYTWHAALLEPSTHTTIVEDTAQWQFS